MTGRPARRVPQRTCYRCDAVFRVASPDARVYCWRCRHAYGFPTPTTPHTAALLPPEVRSA